MLKTLDETTNSTQQQWVKFMLERVGHNNLPRLLEYYESIGWISIDVVNMLLALAENEKVQYNGSAWTLSPEEHRISMLFIEKLIGRQVDIPFFPVSAHAKAIIKPSNRTDKLRESFLEAYQQEKEDKEFAINRREVTIKNLELELEKRDAEISKLKERLQELEEQYEECRTELEKNKVYREILEENVRLKKISLRGKI